MRFKILAWLAFAVILSTIAYATGTCTDSDGGPIDPAKPTRFIGIKGFVDYGTGPKEDYCVSRFGGSFMPWGEWVREYYCDGDNIASEDYNCKDYKYGSCVNGTCINYTGTQAELDDVGTALSKENYSNCGNKKLDGKEECDPPGKVCMIAGGGMGTCTNQCKCVKLSQNMTIKSEVNSTQQNQTQNATSGQTINQNKTGHNSEAKLTFETKEEEKPIIESKESTEDEKTKAPSTPTGAIPADVQEIMEETDKEIAKMADNPMIKITSAITKAVMKIWSLVSGLFGGD